MENEGERPLTKKERRELAKQERQKERVKSETFSKFKKYGIWLGILLVVGFFGFGAVKYLFTPSQNNSDMFSISQADHVKGNQSAGVTLIEYSDFQCPACKITVSLIEQLLSDYPNDLRFVFRDYPLTTIHKNALPAAKAAQAASAQGKFWEMHDLLFEKQEEWSDESNIKERFSEYAQSLGLDKDKFSRDYDSKEVEEAIKADITGGARLRINSTPTIYLNGKKIEITGYEQLKQEVEKLTSSQ